MKPLLTKKEIRIIELICRQYQNTEIALKLKRSKRTIEGHREIIYEKTKCRSIIGLVLYALANGIFSFNKITKSAKNIDLTAREIQVINLICRQYSSLDIGEKLKLNVRTVEGYRSDILKKTKSKTVVGILLFAIKNDIYKLKKSSRRRVSKMAY